MNLVDKLLRSILEQDEAAIVVCDLEHTIVYMNPAARVRYAKRGGGELLGKSLRNCHNEQSNIMIDKVIQWFGQSNDNNKVHTFFNVKENKDVYMVALRDEDGTLIGYYEKHEYRTVDETPLYQF